MIKEVLEPKTKRAGKRVICICDNCGKEFESKYSEQTRRGKTQHFCSWECYKEGHIITAETREKLSINSKKHLFFKSLDGIKNPNWRGGITKNSRGYIEVLKPNHPFSHKSGYIQEHRYIMEQAIGRYLKPEEVIHHINGIKTDNRIENLMLFKNSSEHTKYHLKIKNLWGALREPQLV
jgi:YHS domain-containing protein